MLRGMEHTKGLPVADPGRYGSLHHPGDEYSYDIFTQAARAVGPDREMNGVDPLRGLSPRLLIATGASQSAMRLASYVNIVDDRERLFDGFFPTVHWGIAPHPPDQALQASFAGPDDEGFYAGSAAIHDRGRVPVLVLCSESEAQHNLPVRQPDSPTFRFWEMAGTAHVSAGSSDESRAIMLRDGIQSILQDDVANSIDWTYVRNAALEHLVRWADGGSPPPSFPPIEVTPAREIVRDGLGNARGGVRLPELEVPTATHSGTNARNPLAALSGQSTPLSDEALSERYTDAESYLSAWDAAVDRARAEGIVLDDDLDAVRARGRRTAAERWGSATSAVT
jgi:hypothetical protein